MTSDLDSLAWTVFHATPKGPGRLRRPAAPVLTTFDEIWNDRSPTNLQVVPIEAVQAGDRQVLAAGYPEGWCFDPVISLDPLADFPQVSSVIASTIVTARRPLPNVRELILLHDAPPPDDTTLRNLTRLESFFAGTAKKPVPKLNIEALNIEALPSETLSQLALSRYCVDGLEPLSRLVHLRDLRLLNCRRPDSVRHLGALTKLRYLVLSGGFSGGWKSLRGCSELEEVFVSDVSLGDLRAFDTWTHLRRFRFGGKLGSLAGIEAFRALEEFRMDRGSKPTTINDVAPLRGLPRLSSLHINTGTVLDLSPLSELPALRSLELSGYAKDGEPGVESLRPLARCVTLEELQIYKMSIKDGDISVLNRLPNLQRFSMGLDDGSMADAVAEFQRRRPDVKVHYDDGMKAEPDVPGIKVGEVVIHPPTEGSDTWYIFDDLVDLLGGSGNASVEKKVQRAVAAKDRELLDRLDFDSEADNFCVHTEAESDIRAVAAIINELASKRRDAK